MKRMMIWLLAVIVVFLLVRCLKHLKNDLVFLIWLKKHPNIIIYCNIFSFVCSSWMLSLSSCKKCEMFYINSAFRWFEINGESNWCSCWIVYRLFELFLMYSRKNRRPSSTPSSSLANSLRASHTRHSQKEEEIFDPDLHLEPGKDGLLW